MRRLLLLVVVLAASAPAVACTGHADSPKRTSSAGVTVLRWHDCDPAVEARFLSRHRCGTLTVPMDRRHPAAGTAELAVVQSWPVGIDPQDGVGIGFGDNLGDPRVFSGSSASGATRLGRVVVDLAFRGTSPTTPVLTCPEVDALAVEAPGRRDDDRALRTRFVAAVGACATRLRKAGVDPGAFDAGAAAADVEDLRVAMGLDAWWGGGSYGTQSRILFRYLRDFPGALGVAWVDSPWFPDLDDLTGGVLGARSALRELFAACDADARCRRAYPALEDSWGRALRRTALTPLRGTGADEAGAQIPVVVDDAKLLRFVRYSLGGDGVENVRWLPRVISEAASGRLDPHLADLVAADPLFCAGYRPQCVRREPFAWGVYLTSLCQEQLAGLDEAKLRRAVRGKPAYEQVFENSPYLDACGAWDTPPATAPPAADPGGTALLLLPGDLDSFARPAWSDGYASEWSAAYVFTVPHNTHNTLGFDECGLGVRNAWVRDPRRPPNPANCLAVADLAFE